MNRKTMILILGRSGVGKDTIANILSSKYGLKQVISYTTRPRRDGEGETHYFISPEEVDKYTNKAATTKIGDYEYFTTESQLDDCDIYIIDPIGFDCLIKKYPEKSFLVLYVTSDNNKSREKAILRGKSLSEGEIYDKRRKDENEEFKKFEETIANIKYDNVYYYGSIFNDYIMDDLVNQIDKVYDFYRKINKK